MKPLSPTLQTSLWNLWLSDIGKVITDTKALGDAAGIGDYQSYLVRETQHVWTTIAPLLDASTRRTANETFFSIVPALDLNGVACTLPSKKKVIGVSIATILLAVFDLHLCNALRHLDRILPRLRTEGATPDMRAMASLVEELMYLRAVARLVAGVADDLNEMPSDELDNLVNYDRVVGPIYGAQFFFIVLHELGHICLGHIDSPQHRKAVGGTNLVESFCTPDHEMEHQADCFALGIMRQKSLRLEIPLGAFFAFLRFVEEASVLYQHSSPHDPPMNISIQPAIPCPSHPTATSRVKRLVADCGFDQGWFDHVWGVLQTRIH